MNPIDVQNWAETARAVFEDAIADIKDGWLVDVDHLEYGKAQLDELITAAQAAEGYD